MQDIVEQLLKYLSNTGWDEALFHYFHSEEFEQILVELKRQSDAGHKFCPTMGKAFRWMQITPLDTVKVAMMIDDGTNYMDHPGIPYVQDMSRMAKIESARSNAARYKGRGKDIRICSNLAIKRFLCELVPDDTVYFDYDLTRWCKQGVLMMPYACTARIGGRIHGQLWNDFRARVIDIINIRYPEIPFLLVGDRTWTYEDLIESRYTLPVNVYLENNHPDWYKIVNEWLAVQKQEPIQWS